MCQSMGQMTGVPLGENSQTPTHTSLTNVPSAPPFADQAENVLTLWLDTSANVVQGLSLENLNPVKVGICQEASSKSGLWLLLAFLK